MKTPERNVAVTIWGHPCVDSEHPNTCETLIDLGGHHPKTWRLSGMWTPNGKAIPDLTFTETLHCKTRPHKQWALPDITEDKTRARVDQSMFCLIREQFKDMYDNEPTPDGVLKNLEQHIATTSPPPPHPLANVTGTIRDEHRRYTPNPENIKRTVPVEIWVMPDIPSADNTGKIRSYVWLAADEIDGRYYAGIEGIGTRRGVTPRFMSSARSGVSHSEGRMIARSLGVRPVTTDIETDELLHDVQMPFIEPDHTTTAKLGEAPTELAALRAALFNIYDKGWRTRYDRRSSTQATTQTKVPA